VMGSLRSAILRTMLFMCRLAEPQRGETLDGAGAASVRGPVHLPTRMSVFACDGSIRNPSAGLMWEYSLTIITLRYDFVFAVALDQPARG
jgi:hypothetical protein